MAHHGAGDTDTVAPTKRRRDASSGWHPGGLVRGKHGHHPQGAAPAPGTRVGGHLGLPLSGVARGLRRRDGQCSADARQLLSPAPISQKAVVANAHQPLGQDVQQETVHERLAVRGQGLGALAIAGIPDAEAHLSVADLQQTRIGDGDTMRVARQVLHHRLGLVQTMLGVNHPVFAHEGVEHLLELTGAGDAMQRALVRGAPEQRHHPAPEVTRQGLDGEQVVASARTPPALRIQGAAGNQAVQMHMPRQVLRPGVQHRAHAQLPAQALAVLAEGLTCLPARLEQQPVEQLGMQLHPSVELVRDES